MKLKIYALNFVHIKTTLLHGQLSSCKIVLVFLQFHKQLSFTRRKLLRIEMYIQYIHNYIHTKMSQIKQNETY